MLKFEATGFPSPAADLVGVTLDLNELLINHPAATFFTRVKGSSMVQAGIRDGDLLIVDRSISPADNHVVVAMLNSNFTLKRLRKVGSKYFLVTENDRQKKFEITPEDQFEVWGVVTFVIGRV
ncbi:MAG: translesion error-prone DNA polymerase V autoproteolytic subunit [Proteobacteria bacterium]|nr:translesion error-prone DNA polymerase V autoproteolytic subunit [Pseudomonadota bacterium]